MQHFTYTASLPQSNQTVDILEFFYSEYKHLNKILLNNDDRVIISFFDNLLRNKCTGINVQSLCFIDKLIILLTMRSICISPEIELTVTCPITNKPFNYVLQTTDVINALQKINLPENLKTVTKTYKNGSLIVSLALPTALSLQDSDNELISSVIHNITLNGTDITDKKTDVQNHLPIEILQDIKEYVTAINTILHDIEIVNIISPFAPNTGFIKVPLNIFNNSVLEFLKICFKRGLYSLYELEYFLTKHLNLDNATIISATPAELSIYINLYRDEKQQEEKNHKDNKDLNPLHP